MIEKVEGPTSWVSALVPIPKSNNDIHLCVDLDAQTKLYSVKDSLYLISTNHLSK